MGLRVTFFHWTLADRAASIRTHGFRGTTYDPIGDGVLGVHVSDDPDYFRNGHDTRMVIEVPDDEVQPRWLVTDPEVRLPDAEQWRLPPDVATRYLV